MSGFWTCHECGAEMYGFENCQFCGAHKGGGEAMTSTTELLKDYAFTLRRLEYDADKPGSNMTLGEYEAEEKKITDEYSQAIAATLGNMGKSRWFELFGTPERAAETLKRMDVDACNWCVNSSGNPEDCRACPYKYDYYGCYLPEKFSMLEWLKSEVVE